MSTAYADRAPTKGELGKLRLILSTFQDGTGMLNLKGRNLPGWRDFERAIALAFGGEAQESKAVFDVLLTDPVTGRKSGLSCKMRDTLRETKKTGQATIEVSNSAGYFWKKLKQNGLNEQSYHIKPGEAGQALLHLVGEWHVGATAQDAMIDLNRSYYLALQWDRRGGDYELYQFPIKFPDPTTLHWEVVGKRLVGWQDADKLFEWYGLSGGQLKYYPRVESAIWSSDIFQLEPLPPDESGYGLIRKAADLFPQLWQEACDDA